MKKRSTKCLVNISIKNLFFNIWSTFKQHNHVDQSISVSQIMYSKSLGLDCQRFFFAALLPFQIPTPGIFPYWSFFNFKVSNTGPTHRGKTQNLKVPIHTEAPHIGKKNVNSQSPHTQVKKAKSQSPQTQEPHAQ